MKFNKLTGFLLIFLLAFILMAAKFQDNEIKLGDKNATDKTITFDTGDGASNKTLVIDGATKNVSINSNEMTIGDGAASDKKIIIDKGSGASNPSIRWNNSTSKLQLANDGSTFSEIATAATAATPPGVIITFAGASCPSGYLETDGTAVSRTTYAALYAVTGDIHGYGDNSTTFNLPDLRGKYIRGYDNTAGNDPDAATRTACNTGGATGDNIGSCQTDLAKAVQTHNHKWIEEYTPGSGWYYHKTWNSAGTKVNLPTQTRYINTSGQWLLNLIGPPQAAQVLNGSYTDNETATGTETRPLNVTMIYCVKY